MRIIQLPIRSQADQFSSRPKLLKFCSRDADRLRRHWGRLTKAGQAGTDLRHWQGRRGETGRSDDQRGQQWHPADLHRVVKAEAQHEMNADAQQGQTGNQGGFRRFDFRPDSRRREEPPDGKWCSMGNPGVSCRMALRWCFMPLSDIWPAARLSRLPAPAMGSRRWRKAGGNQAAASTPF